MNLSPFVPPSPAIPSLVPPKGLYHKGTKKSPDASRIGALLYLLLSAFSSFIGYLFLPGCILRASSGC